MDINLRQKVDQIIAHTLNSIQIDQLVKESIISYGFKDKVVLVAIGKAAWQMAKSASDCLGDKLIKGVVVTKYDHVLGDINNVDCYEAGHPVLDENSIIATEKVLAMMDKIDEEVEVLFLVSGGGSALFESPMISLEELQSINNQLLLSGANIIEINTIRKRLSKVKGGKFAKRYKNHIHSIIISDVLGNKLDSIASGPTYIDMTTSKEALNIIEKYNLNLEDRIIDLIKQETVKELNNVSHEIISSVHELCYSCAEACENLGFKPIIITETCSDVASDIGKRLGKLAKEKDNDGERVAYIIGGESVVIVKGKGLGGRNQEIALSAALEIDGINDVCVFSLGSDGTDGPTDAAGGYVDKDTVETLSKSGINASELLANNDSYHALEACGGLIKTGPTGTNVNDVSVVLIDKNKEKN